MKVTIQGLTDATIKFNTTGITMRGKERANHIDITSAAQERELRELMSVGLISVIDESQVGIPVAQEPIEPKPKAIGRPKGAKDKKPRKKAAKKDSEEPEEPEGPEGPEEDDLVAEAVAKAINSETLELQESDKVVVGTDDGAVKTSTRNKASGEIPESEATRASIETMKRLEAEEAGEEAEEAEAIDESKLDPSEQMGLNAIIATGEGLETKPMVNSILPEAELIDANPIAEGVTEETGIFDAGDEFNPFIDEGIVEATDTEGKRKDPFIEI